MKCYTGKNVAVPQTIIHGKYNEQINNSTGNLFDFSDSLGGIAANVAELTLQQDEVIETDLDLLQVTEFNLTLGVRRCKPSSGRNCCLSLESPK